MNTPTIKIYRIRHRNDWCGADTIFDSYCLALKKPRKWFNISKFQELFPDWKYVIDETNRKGKEAGKENFFTDSSPETSGDENEESDGETDSELSQTILPQWPIENDQTDDDPLPLPPFNGVIDNKNNLFKINNYIIEKIVITTDSDTEVDDKEKLKDVLFEPTCHIDDVINIESD